MAVESKRGCGYRKVGGLYMMGSGLAARCDRMPYRLDRCPTCGNGVKFTRGVTWLQPDFFPVHEGCHDHGPCPVCGYVGADKDGEIPSDDHGPHLLLWIGRAHYSPESYLDESRRLGISRRLSAVPKGLVLGETWVLLAHLDAVPARVGLDGVPACAKCNADRSKHIPRPSGELWCPDPTGDRPWSSYEPAKPTSGIFAAFIPDRLELLLKESDATDERREKEAKRNVTVVAVPDDDKDHQGSVWDKEDEEPQPALPGVLQ